MKSSALNAVIKADVEDATNKLLRSAIDPWVFFNSHGVSISRADGRKISIKGVEFPGSVNDVFWGGFADEFIRKVGRELIESTRCKAIERNIPVSSALSDCLGYLRIMIEKIFYRMADIDQRLRGKGYPRSVVKRDVSKLIEKNYEILESIIDSEVQSSGDQNRNSGWWHSFFELKPNFFGMGLNINFLIDWMRKRKKTANNRVDPTA